ncbi:MAG TPA: hypothetical protein VKY74_04820 [Chloroflexia bacterium]|nr:hypothetical protein [Chloroflexia bacterium]
MAVLATGAFDGQVHLWDARTGALLQTLDHTDLHGGQHQISAVAWSADGRLLATADSDALWYQGNNVIIWEPGTGRRRAVLPHRDDVGGLAFAAHNQLLISAGRHHGEILTWDLGRGTVRQRLARYGLYGMGSGVSPDGGRVVIESTDDEGQNQQRSVQVWDIARRAPLPLLVDNATPLFAPTIAFSPDGQWFAAPLDYDQVGVWRLADGRLGKTLEADAEEGWDLQLAFSPDSVQFATLPAGRLSSPWPLHGARIGALAASPDGRLLATAADDGTVGLWDAATGAPRGRVAHAARVDSLAFSPDSRILAAGGGEGDDPESTEVHLWEVATGTLLGTLPETAPWVGFTADSRTLVSVTRAGAVQWHTLPPA